MLRAAAMAAAAAVVAASGGGGAAGSPGEVHCATACLGGCSAGVGPCRMPGTATCVVGTDGECPAGHCPCGELDPVSSGEGPTEPWGASTAAAVPTATAPAPESPMDPRVISVFGSSVANGAFCSGNCSGNAGVPAGTASGGCYQSRLRVFQRDGGTGTARSVFNNCHGGDTTAKPVE